MATIKSWEAVARQVRTEAMAEIKDLQARIRVVMQERDQRLVQIKAEIEMIRSARNAKVQANAAKRQASQAAKQADEDRLRKQAMEAAAKKAKEWAAKCHPDHGGTNDGFRAAYAVWKDLEALARQ